MQFLCSGQSQICADILEATFGSGNSLGQGGVPCVVIVACQLFGNQVITVSGLAVAGVEHDVAAVLGLHDAGIANFMCIEAPVFECSHHLAGMDILVQTAGGAVAVIGLLVGQGSEGILGSLAGLPLGQDLLSLSLGSGDLFLGVGHFGVIVLFALHMVVLEGHQNVTDVLQCVGVVVGAAEQNNVVTVDLIGFAGDDGDVAGLALSSGDPVEVDGEVVGNAPVKFEVLPSQLNVLTL